MARLSQTGGAFGVKCRSAEGRSRFSVPAHLRIQQFKVPGPGEYDAPSSISVRRRDSESTQDCTWQYIRGWSNDLPKKNPGPGTY
jgi:hypothetical protein